MSQRLRRSALLFVFCSIFLHLLAGFSVFIIKPPTPTHRPEQVEVSYQTPEELKKAADAPQTQQIVDQDQRLNDENDPNAKFLSAFNQRVEKQTRAQQNGKFINQATPAAAPVAAQQQGNEHHGKAEKKERGDLPTLAALKPQFNPNPSPVEPAENRRPGQASATDDYLKDVESGLQTMLSTREFVYFSYYSRIKEKIRQHWEPNIRERVKMIFRQGRTIASTKDHITQVIITLDRGGALLKVDVVTASGVEALDDAAIDAFKAAAPFPNPPKGLIDADGTIKIRWDFVLEASSIQPKLQFQHYAKDTSDESDSDSGL